MVEPKTEKMSGIKLHNTPVEYLKRPELVTTVISLYRYAEQLTAQLTEMRTHARTVALTTSMRQRGGLCLMMLGLWTKPDQWASFDFTTPLPLTIFAFMLLGVGCLLFLLPVPHHKHSRPQEVPNPTPAATEKET